MTILKIKMFPDKILRHKAEHIKNIDREILKLLDNMAETMYNAPGIGLAANQVGVLKRLIVMDCSSDEEDPELYKMINPEIIFKSEPKKELEEGCLSIPKYKSIVSRPAEVTVSYTNTFGIKEELNASDILAACIQHEIDHLNGVLFIDHISKLKKDIILRKIKKQLRDKKDPPNE